MFWNEGAEKITGYLRQDVLGHPCESEFPEHADADNHPLLRDSAALIATLREGHAKSSGASIRTKNGHFVVAYVDFVTAKMALFIVLRQLNSCAKVPKAVGGYFKDPIGTSKTSAPLWLAAAKILSSTKSICRS